MDSVTAGWSVASLAVEMVAQLVVSLVAGLADWSVVYLAVPLAFETVERWDRSWAALKVGL